MHWHPFHIFKKENIDDGKLMTKVIYNTRHNLIILISYSHDYFYSIIELMQAVNRSNIKSIISHDAREKEYTEEELQEFDKKRVEIIDNRYYLLLSGSPESYIDLYYCIDNLSNEVLEMITNDIYNHCSSAYLKDLIGFGILDLNKFKFQNIVPNNYNTLHEFKIDDSKYSSAKYTKHYVDNIELILNSIPECFSAIDIARIINFYYLLEDSKDLRFINSAALIIYVISNSDNTDVLNYYNLIARATRDFVFKRIVADPSIETLNIVNLPVFLRENLEDMLTGNKPIEEMDEIFQKDYDRFTQPTADYAGNYEDIDEQIGADEETENMRKEDILDDSTESM